MFRERSDRYLLQVRYFVSTPSVKRINDDINLRFLLLDTVHLLEVASSLIQLLVPPKHTSGRTRNLK